MRIYESIQWIDDIDKVIQYLPELSTLQGKKVMITGATGLICSSIIDVLLRFNDTHDIPIQIIAAGRSEDRVRQRFGNYFEKDFFQYVKYDASNNTNNLNIFVDYIIHGASNAYPTKIFQEPVETMLSNFNGVEGLLDYAKRTQVSRLLYISSSEVYGEKESIRSYEEKDYGYVNLLNPRNSYSVGKRAAETLCISYAKEYGVDSVIVRPGHIYGPTASKEDNRVSSIWAFSAAKGDNIVMKSSGEQLRSYCYCLDCASAILKVLINGQEEEAYNISNPDSVITIKQIAKLFAKFGGVQVEHDVPSEQEKAAFNSMKNSSLNSIKLQKLGWISCFNAETGVEHTIKILRDIL